MTRTLECLDKACECYKMIKSLYSAAKMLEQAVLICRYIIHLYMFCMKMVYGNLLKHCSASAMSVYSLDPNKPYGGKYTTEK